MTPGEQDLFRETLDWYAELVQQKRAAQVSDLEQFIVVESAAVLACDALASYAGSRWDARLQQELQDRGVAFRKHDRKERSGRIASAYAAVPAMRGMDMTSEAAVRALLDKAAHSV